MAKNLIYKDLMDDGNQTVLKNEQVYVLEWEFTYHILSHK